jgi:hypothetical protein
MHILLGDWPLEGDGEIIEPNCLSFAFGLYLSSGAEYGTITRDVSPEVLSVFSAESFGFRRTSYVTP